MIKNGTLADVRSLMNRIGCFNGCHMDKHLFENDNKKTKEKLDAYVRLGDIIKKAYGPYLDSLDTDFDRQLFIEREIVSLKNSLGLWDEDDWQYFDEFAPQFFPKEPVRNIPNGPYREIPEDEMVKLRDEIYSRKGLYQNLSDVHRVRGYNDGYVDVKKDGKYYILRPNGKEYHEGERTDNPPSTNERMIFYNIIKKAEELGYNIHDCDKNKGRKSVAIDIPEKGGSKFVTGYLFQDYNKPDLFINDDTGEIEDLTHQSSPFMDTPKPVWGER